MFSKVLLFIAYFVAHTQRVKSIVKKETIHKYYISEIFQIIMFVAIKKYTFQHLIVSVDTGKACIAA